VAIARDTTCPYCGLIYDEMRTGLTYSCIYSMLWSASEDPSTWRYKRRRTILGLWHSIKRDQWYDHLRYCEELEQDRQDEAEAQAEREAIMAADMYPDDASWIFDEIQDDIPF
jgi:hypothetical protein